MKIRGKIALFLFSGLCALMFFSVIGETQQKPETENVERRPVVQTEESQKQMTPQKALDILKKGNERFVQNVSYNRDLQDQMLATAPKQYPLATILSCQDSRTSNEMIFDLNNGDAFSLRIAGNIINPDILGGMEYGSVFVKVKLIAVIGHTDCGAVKGAINNVNHGNLTGLLDKIKPAINSVKPGTPQFVYKVTVANVRESMKQVRCKSESLNDLIEKGEVGLVGGIYDVATGKVVFFEDKIECPDKDK